MQKFHLSLLLLVCAALGGVVADFCHTSECRAQRQNLWDVKNYKKEAQKYKELLANSSCSICNIPGNTLCYNGGTCTPVGLYNYTCTCPDYVTGQRCETILSCDDTITFCGKNALCHVDHHDKYCTCPPGYSGDPKVNCDLEVKQACLYGDPHFVTFDQAKYNYMGTCPYYVMKACDKTIDFSIEAVNFFCSQNTESVTCIKEFTLRTLGHSFKVDQNLHYWIDGYPFTLPYSWPDPQSPDTAQIYADQNTGEITINDRVHNMSITFTLSSYQLCVTVPLTPFFYGNDTMCGLFGNIDNNCLNDVRAINNSLIVFPTCDIGTNQQAIEFMDTWVSDSSVNNCLEGALMANLTTTNANCTMSDAQTKCDLIRQAFNGNGPFGACQAMGHDLVDQYYHDCTYSVCEANCDPSDSACNTKTQCDVLDTFADLCMVRLPMVDIDSWRTDDFCPYKCPPFSKYSLKTPACQDSCPDNHYSNSSICQDHFVEGCICDSGYFFDANSDLEGYKYVCRPLEECGCKDNNGTYFAPGSVTLDPTCSTRTSCLDGLLIIENIQCSVNGQCNNVNGYPTCQCSAGYRGDGYNCTDINECVEDPTKCNANINQGTCNNLPGTYNCSCYAPYEGAECTDYKPKRHCADLKSFHAITVDGAYNVSIGADFSLLLYNDQLNWTTVYCDMTTNNGGWTLMAHGNNTGGVSYTSYVNGFGDPSTQNAWLGLENIHLMTTTTQTSLRVVIEKCPVDNEPTQNCIYNYFNVKDSSSQYAIVLNGTCQDGSQEGWIAWDTNSVGPAFSTFDVPDAYNCSGQFYNVGWWYKNSRTCGKANLNGLRFACGDKNSNDDKESYISWYNNPIKDAYMYLRPRYFPLYDSHISHPTIPPPPPTEAPTAAPEAVTSA